MKKIIFLASMLFTVAFFSQSIHAQTEAQKVELCSKVAGGSFLQSYPVQLPAVNDGERPPMFRQPTALRGKNTYRFTICTDEESAGEAILQVFDEGKVIFSTYNNATGKQYPYIDFDCTKTAAYLIVITFKDGREGSAVAILSHLKTL